MMQMKLITLIVKLNLKLQCYSQVCVITVMHTLLKEGYQSQQPQLQPQIIINNNNEIVIFKNCASFTDCISEVNITQTLI